MRATHDFNYKVALASGLKSLQAGRLRQAEEQFRYLVEKFPGMSGGYRGLAKVLVELEDRSAAFVILRDGGTALAKAGDRSGGSALFREAVGMEPRDTTTHRRFAATLAVSGDLDAAAAEVERYVDAHSGPAGDRSRAQLEVAYALERFGAHPQLAALAARFGISAPESAPAAAEIMTYDRVVPPPAESLPAQAPPALEDDGEAEATAAELIARRDPAALRAGLAAARYQHADGRTDAASDLLLQLISRGIGGHEAQQLLATVIRGRRPDLADEKSALLAEVERLAKTG